MLPHQPRPLQPGIAWTSADSFSPLEQHHLRDKIDRACYSEPKLGTLQVAPLQQRLTNGHVEELPGADEAEEVVDVIKNRLEHLVVCGGRRLQGEKTVAVGSRAEQTVAGARGAGIEQDRMRTRPSGWKQG